MNHPGQPLVGRSARPPVRLVPTPSPVAAPLVPDPDQALVIAHAARPGAGPLLVLAGPGTGKTATVVEAVAQRLEAGTPAERVLVLTFSRKAAGELRDRIAARVGVEGASATAWTFHAYCYALVGQVVDPEDPSEAPRPVRLLPAPEQDAVVRDLLAGHLAEGFVRWPDDLRPALGTRGFADEVRTAFAAVRGAGLDPDQVPRARPEGAALADALDEYLDVLDHRGVVDYTELVHRAVAFATSDEGAAFLHDRYDLVVVDEYQDTDPSQERLLQAVAGGGRDLVVVGDPDQSIYAFRGADVRGILDFPARFPRSDGVPAPVLALRVCRRSGEVLVEAARTLARRLPVTGSAFTGSAGDHRDRMSDPVLPPGAVQVRTFPSSGAQYDAVVDELRRAHLDDAVPWDAMAVLVRSAASIPSVRRALLAGGVPTEVASDEVPLANDPAVAPLLLALRVVLDPEAATTEQIRALLLSAWCGADPVGLRRLARALREEARAGLADPGALATLPSSADLLRRAVLEPERLLAHDPDLAGPARRLGLVLRRAGDLVADGAGVHDVVWTLFDQQPWRDAGLRSWGERLERAAFAGGPAGRRADRDLDALVAFMDLAARADQSRLRGGVRTFFDLVAAQQIPGETLSERGIRAGAVRVLTAHRSKGLEWDVVAVVDVHEGSWPDLRSRGSILDPDLLVGRPADTPATLLAHERRLFYVACTRARRRLLVTAVASTGDGDRPSRFLDELGVEPVHVPGRTRRPLAIAPLVAELRRAVVDPGTDPSTRDHAAALLAGLAGVQHDGRALVPTAHPDHWWGLSARTERPEPLFPVDTPIRLSGSSLDGLTTCALQWYLAHEVRGEPARTTAVGFGSVVHALADDLARHDDQQRPTEWSALLDRVWAALEFEARWQSERERREAEAALARFLAWHRDDRGRTLVATERTFELPVIVGGREVLLRGAMDRIERDDQGRLVVVDLKTMATPPTGPQVAAHVQLGLYQLAVRDGAVSDRAVSDGAASDRAVSDGAVSDGAVPDADPGGVEPGGAELVQLRIDDGTGRPKVQTQPPLPVEGAPTWIDTVLADGVDRLDREDFAPDPVGGGCRYCAFRSVCPAQEEGRELL